MTRYAVVLLLFCAPLGRAAERDAALVNSLPVRNIGPATMGGRIVDLDVVENNPKVMIVAAATGGLWKTADGGDTWQPVFDGQPTQSLGAVAIAPSNPEVIWVGAGEANPRNSVSWGDGVYRSLDGGKTWKHLGLRETHHIGRIVVHPKDPDTAYVAALGHLWGPNPERGIFKTSDGGKTWQHSLALDNDTGCVDVALDPAEPDTLYAAAYRVRRDGFSGGNPAQQFGEKAGLYKTTDAGKTWKKMDKGLPTRQYGRCGLNVYRKDPKIVYAVVQTDRTPTTTQGATPKAGEDLEIGGIFRSEDKGETWKKLNNLCPRPFYYGQIRIDPTDDKRIYVLGVSFYSSSDGGKTFASGGGRGVHPDHHALWINPKDPEQVVLGNDGGLYFSRDRTRTWSAVRGICVSQFYAVAVDMRKPYRVYGGLQDNGSWGGPSATSREEGITVGDWYRVAGSDGFYCAVDPTDHNTVYAEAQYGGLQRIDLGGGGMARGRRIKPTAGNPRFNWCSPILLSPHDPKTLYYGGNVVFKSVNRGDKWETISPDLTLGQPGVRSNGNTISVLAESPSKRGLLYTGTDDGKLHVSRDDGQKWTDLSEKVPGVAKDRWITRVECSHFDEGTAYLTIGRHRNDDRKPYLFKTTDHGETWAALANNLQPDAPLHVIRESSKNKDLLFAGTELGLFVSLDGGKEWQKFTRGLPNVPVHDVVIHPRDRELVIATHGRGVWIMDVAPLEELTEKTRAEKVHLCEVKPALALEIKKTDNPARGYRGSNPPYGATIWYHLKDAAKQPPTVAIAEADGKAVVELKGGVEAGLQRVVWDLRPTGGKEVVKPGEYTVTLKAGETMLTRKVKVEEAK